MFSLELKKKEKENVVCLKARVMGMAYNPRWF